MFWVKEQEERETKKRQQKQQKETKKYKIQKGKLQHALACLRLHIHALLVLISESAA